METSSTSLEGVAPTIKRSRSRQALELTVRVGARAGTASTLGPLQFARQHSNKLLSADKISSALSEGSYVFAGILLFSLQFAPHIAPAILYHTVGDHACALPLGERLLVAGYGGLGAHVVILLLFACAYAVKNSGAQCIAGVIGVLLLGAWQFALIFLVRDSFDLWAFEVPVLNALDAKRTLYPEPVPATETYGDARAYALAQCGELTYDNRTSAPCEYLLLLACEPELWHATRGFAWLWVIVDGILSCLFGSIFGFGCIMAAA